MIGQNIWDIFPLFNKKPPKTKHPIFCPICNSRFFFKHAFLFRRSENQYRVDIAVKCSNCALVLQFGVHLTKEQYEKLKKVWNGDRLDYNITGHKIIENDKKT